MNEMKERNEIAVNTKPRRSDRKDKGATMVEYALLVALIAIVAILAISFLGTSVSNQFSRVGSSISGT